MSSLFKQFGTNKQKESEGVEVTYPANADGSIPTFRIARASRFNDKYAKTLERESRPYRRLIQADKLANSEADKINMRVFAQSILLGWFNVQFADGKEMPFNQDNALKLFQMLPDLYDDLESQSRKASLFQDEVAEAEAKN